MSAAATRAERACPLQRLPSHSTAFHRPLAALSLPFNTCLCRADGLRCGRRVLLQLMAKETAEDQELDEGASPGTQTQDATLGVLYELVS